MATPWIGCANLDAMDGERQPIWNFVEVGWPFSETAAQGGRAIQPDEIKAAVWHSIIAGAQGIIYFNHSFGGPEPDTARPARSGLCRGTRRGHSTNALIEQLAPVLNSPFDDGFVTANPSVRAMAKFYDGEHYVFAGSTESPPARLPSRWPASPAALLRSSAKAAPYPLRAGSSSTTSPTATRSTFTRSTRAAPRPRARRRSAHSRPTATSSATGSPMTTPSL